MALRGVSFAIHHGEAVAVVGGNGAGKSTLLLHLNGVLLPTQGAVLLGQTPINAGNRELAQRTVGMVFQNPDDQLFMPTVAEDVGYGLLPLALGAAEVRARVERVLATVGAQHIIDRAPYHLSGGEKRAAAIAGVLVMEPDVLVMDEPSAGLDPVGRRRLIGLLQQFTHTRVIATHDLDLVLDVCTRVLVLHQGVIAADGAPQALLRDADLLQRCNLEPPLSYQRR